MNGPWLVIIDMQNIFSPDTPGTEWGCPDFNTIISPIRALAAHYGERTLMTRFVAGQNHQGSWKPYYEKFKFAAVPDNDPLYDIVEPLRDLDRGDNVVTMTTFSKWGDEQRGLRSKTGAFPHLVLCGVATDCCVLSTAMAAAEAGAFVTVVLDACAASSATNQEAAKNILIGYAPLIAVTNTQEWLA